MTWLHWALLSALFAGLTAVLAKAGVKDIDSNLATAIRTLVILVFAWSIAFFRGFDTLNKATTRTWLFLILSGLATGASWLCYFRALQLGAASQVAPVKRSVSPKVRRTYPAQPAAGRKGFYRASPLMVHTNAPARARTRRSVLDGD